MAGLAPRRQGKKHSDERLRRCHGAGLGATIFSSRIDVLAFPWVSVAFRATRVHCHGDSISPVSVPFRCVLWVSAEFCGVLWIGNHCMDSVAIRALSIVIVLAFFPFFFTQRPVS